MGNDFQKLQIALAMANIDLAIMMPAPEEPEKGLRTKQMMHGLFEGKPMTLLGLHGTFSRYVGIFQTASA